VFTNIINNGIFYTTFLKSLTKKTRKYAKVYFSDQGQILLCKLYVISISISVLLFSVDVYSSNLIHIDDMILV
jgi:hypothetical protein